MSDQRASHDTVNPPNLVQFMLKKWKTPTPPSTKPLRNAKVFAQRRAELSRRFPDELLIIASGHLKVRANDTHYPFRPSSDFYYLTGCVEPDCVVVFFPTSHGHEIRLYVEPNPGKTDATFFTDRIKGELWEGARLGVEGSRSRFGIPGTRGLPELTSDLEKCKSPRLTLDDPKLSTTLSEMRLIKDATEIRELQSAVRATFRGFEDVIRRMKTAKNERELEGTFWTRARMEGNDVGYGSIVASGAHACTLHWKKNNGPLSKRDLLLLDAGIEGNSLYTADITRTFPIGGKFSREQRTIYSLVLKAQRAALIAVKPGNDFLEPNRVAMRVLAHGLEELGILPTSAEEALKDENQFYKRYSLHNVSHMLGLDVHDCAQARSENYKYGRLEPGMVLTIEPGLYFQLDDLTVPTKYRGIGIRIEDDVVVTKTGCRNLSGFIPTDPDQVEKWIRKVWAKK